MNSINRLDLLTKSLVDLDRNAMEPASDSQSNTQQENLVPIAGAGLITRSPPRYSLANSSVVFRPGLANGTDRRSLRDNQGARDTDSQTVDGARPITRLSGRDSPGVFRADFVNTNS